MASNSGPVLSPMLIDRDRIGVGAQSEVGAVAEAEQAGVAPHQGKREREQRPDQQHRGRVRVDEHRPEQEHSAPARNQPQRIWPMEGQAVIWLFRKKRPLMPCGMRRSRMIASASRAISPITGEEAKETIWLTTPKSAVLANVPAITDRRHRDHRDERLAT